MSEDQRKNHLAELSPDRWCIIKWNGLCYCFKSLSLGEGVDYASTDSRRSIKTWWMGGSWLSPCRWLRTEGTHFTQICMVTVWGKRVPESVLCGREKEEGRKCWREGERDWEYEPSSSWCNLNLVTERRRLKVKLGKQTEPCRWCGVPYTTLRIMDSKATEEF